MVPLVVGDDHPQVVVHEVAFVQRNLPGGKTISVSQRLADLVPRNLIPETIPITAFLHSDALTPRESQFYVKEPQKILDGRLEEVYHRGSQLSSIRYLLFLV